VGAAYCRQVLSHVRGFPTLRVLRLIRLPISGRRAVPFTVMRHLPALLSSPLLRFRHSSVSGFPLACLIHPYTVRRPSRSQEPTGPPKFSNASLPACHSLRTPADFHMLALTHVSCWLRDTLRPSPSTTHSFRSSTSFQGTRLPLRPAEFSVYASPVLFGYSFCLRHRRNTRYGWVASPYPTGTRTRQDAPSLSWRYNDSVHPPAMASEAPPLTVGCN
jgi:hypothetical protein